MALSLAAMLAAGTSVAQPTQDPEGRGKGDLIRDAGRAAPPTDRVEDQKTDPAEISRSEREDCGPKGGLFSLNRRDPETTSNSRECIDTSGRPTSGEARPGTTGSGKSALGTGPDRR
jgi:hypothetical protein